MYLIFKRCVPSKYWGTEDSDPVCSKYLLFTNILFWIYKWSNLWKQKENKKTYEISCNNVDGECDDFKGLVCAQKDGVLKCA